MGPYIPGITLPYPWDRIVTYASSDPGQMDPTSVWTVPTWLVWPTLRTAPVVLFGQGARLDGSEDYPSLGYPTNVRTRGPVGHFRPGPTVRTRAEATERPEAIWPRALYRLLLLPLPDRSPRDPDARPPAEPDPTLACALSDLLR